MIDLLNACLLFSLFLSLYAWLFLHNTIIVMVLLFLKFIYVHRK